MPTNRPPLVEPELSVQHWPALTWIATRPLWLLALGGVATPLLAVILVSIGASEGYSRFGFLDYFIGLAALMAYIAVICVAIGTECTRLAANIRNDEYSWFRFCGNYVVGFYVYLSVSVAVARGISLHSANLILNGVFCLIGVLTLIPAIKATLLYPVKIANVLERWQAQEGGPKAKFMPPSSPLSFPALILRMGQYYKHEAGRQANRRN
jgi:hypothetical protein